MDDKQTTLRICVNAGLCLLVMMQSVAKLSTAASSFSVNSEPTEYCLDEEFEAKCLHSEVIWMHMALFGRMKTGRCIQDSSDAVFLTFKNDRKFLGCSTSVLNILDEKCTGRPACNVKIMSEISKLVQTPCHESLPGYLEASYTCLSVSEPDRSCMILVTSSSTQHLMTHHNPLTSDSSSTKLSCGSRQQPWKIQAAVGQQIKVSLLDFGGAVNQLDGDCLQYGYIIDREASKNITMCGLKNDRKSEIYQSSSNTLEIFVNSENTDGDVKPKFFLEITGTGCTDLVPPEGSWLRRRGSEAVVGCYTSRQTWHLNCVNNQWSGVIGNCTREMPEEIIQPTVKVKSQITNEVIVTLVVAICGLLICTTIIVCCLVCMRRYTTVSMTKQKYGYDCQTDPLATQTNKA